LPTINIDAEGAALMEAACTMLEAALTARVERADPDKIISSSLKLQANKLATARALMRLPDPPRWEETHESQRAAFLGAAKLLLDNPDAPAATLIYERLRGLVNAPGLPTT
jgi:hypothetical protein